MLKIKTPSVRNNNEDPEGYLKSFMTKFIAILKSLYFSY